LATEAISVRQCLQHTSGWSYYGPLPEYQAAVRRRDRPWRYGKFLEEVHAEKLLFEPGSGWSYSNIGYMVLRRLIETVCDSSFADVVTRQVCKPLGLARTSVIETRSDLLGLTIGYSLGLSRNGYPVDVRPLYDIGWAPTGVVASTASDVVRFYDGLFAGQLLPVHLLGEMCRLRRVGCSHPIFANPSYGLGLMADPDIRFGPVYGHNGEGPGYAASAFHFRHPGGQPLTIAILTNTENYQEAEIMVLKVGEKLTRDHS
jgi:D-alanyl-D-alanine carboxypeptidase